MESSAVQYLATLDSRRLEIVLCSLSYYQFIGKHPWAIENALKRYGDVVRIAPNELVVITLQVELDIYTSDTKNQEHCRKVDSGIPLPDDGISFERDPAKHKQIAKKLAGPWSAKSSKTIAPTMHSYIDAFISKMKEIGDSEEGVDLQVWTDRLAMDMSADLAYGPNMRQLETNQNAPLLDTFWHLNFSITINRIANKSPPSPLKYFFVPLKVLLSHLRIDRLNREALEVRVARRLEPHPSDHIHSMLLATAPAPVGREKVPLEILAGHLLVGGFESVSGRYNCAVMFSLLQPYLVDALVQEVRTTFDKFADIDAESLVSLPFLNAVMHETLRMSVNIAAIVPRESPGAVVDGQYIAKGITVHNAHFAFTRSPRYFHSSRSFHPQRWLPKAHEKYNTVFDKDAIEAFHPFGHGPRACIAMAQGVRQLRLYLAKVTWALDVELVDGQDVDFERDSRLYAMWEKPGMRVRFRAAKDLGREGVPS